jgi:hypothetical protein
MQNAVAWLKQYYCVRSNFGLAKKRAVGVVSMPSFMPADLANFSNSLKRFAFNAAANALAMAHFECIPDGDVR